MSDVPKRKSIRLDFPYRDGCVYFVTICCADKQRYFDDPKLARMVQEDLFKRQNDLRQISMYCYCIMPDHIHILLEINDETVTLQRWVASFKSYSSRCAKKECGIRKLWHVNFYDHVVRGYESLDKLSQYVLYNPVRADLVDDWRDWPYSYLNA